MNLMTVWSTFYIVIPLWKTTVFAQYISRGEVRY